MTFEVKYRSPESKRRGGRKGGAALGMGKRLDKLFKSSPDMLLPARKDKQ